MCTHENYDILSGIPSFRLSAEKDRIFTADALHTQRACCANIVRFGGHYVIIVKKNQPTLWQDIHISNMPAQMRRFCAHPREALSLLIDPLSQDDGTLK